MKLIIPEEILRVVEKKCKKPGNRTFFLPKDLVEPLHDFISSDLERIDSRLFYKYKDFRGTDERTLRYAWSKDGKPEDGAIRDLRNLLCYFGFNRDWNSTINLLGIAEDNIISNTRTLKESFNFLSKLDDNVPGDISVNISTLTDEDVSLSDKDITLSNIHSLNLELPAPPEIFVGRSQFVDEIINKLNEEQRVSVHGPPGIGKTALCLHISNILRKNNKRILWIKVGNQSVSMICNEIGRLLKEESIFNLDINDKYNVIHSIVNRNKINVFVFDDVWSIEETRSFVKHAIPAGCGVLVNGRKRVGIGLPFDLQPLTSPESELLFRYHSNISENVEVQQICNLLGNHPLAIEIAGKVAWINGYSVNFLKDYLNASSDRVKKLALSEAAHESIWASILTSYESLDSREKNVFCCFGSLWAGTATSELISMITSYDQNDVITAIHNLISSSLVKNEFTCDNIEIYRMHDLIYYFSNAVNFEGKIFPKEQVFNNCIQYVLKYSNQCKPDHDHIEAEKNNIFIASKEAFKFGFFNVTNEFALTLYEKGEFLRWRGYVQESIDILTDAVESAEKVNKLIDKGRHLGNLGIAFRQIGLIEQSIDYHSRALKLMSRLENKEGQSDALGEIGWAFHRLGNSEAGLKYLKRALRICRSINDRRWESIWLGTIGRVYKDLGFVDKAISSHKNAYKIMVSINNLRGMGARIGELGWDYEALGQLEKAYDCIHYALQLAKQIGDVRREGVWLASLGSIFIKQGRYESASSVLKDALEIARNINHKTNIANIKYYYGQLYYAQTEYLTAKEFFYKSLNTFKETHQKREISNCWHCIGLCCIGLIENSNNINDYYIEAKTALNFAINIRIQIKDANANVSKLKLNELRHYSVD